MKSDLFVAYNARCGHGLPIPPDESGCSLCERIEELLNRKPPFTVECLDNYHPLEKGKIYTVVVVVREGASQNGSVPGVMLKGEGKGCVNELFPVTKFKVVP